MAKRTKPVPELTAHFRLAENLLGADLADFICSRRKSGLSLNRIARELWTATDGEVDVTGQTIGKWFDRIKAAA